VAREITQRQLRNESGKTMRALDRGESFIVTRNGVAIGELQPVHRRFVPAKAVLAAFENASTIAFKRFRRDIDRYVS